MPSIPITQEKATLFAAYLGAEGLAAATVESYLAALRHYRLLLEPASPCPSFHTPYMKLLLRGIQRVRACEGPKTIRLPITTTLMHRIKESLRAAPKDYWNLLTWDACCTGFFGFLRCGEFLLPDGAQFDPSIHLSLADLAFAGSSDQGVIRLQIKASKTDQGRVGTTIVLASTGKDICPVLALLDYLGSRGSTPGPLFAHPDLQPLRRHTFVEKVQQALTAAGVEGSQFNGHSFRIGAATSASAAGVAETTIKLLGRWESAAYQRYIRPSPEDLAQVSQQLA